MVLEERQMGDILRARPKRRGSGLGRGRHEHGALELRDSSAMPTWCCSGTHQPLETDLRAPSKLIGSELPSLDEADVALERKPQGSKSGGGEGLVAGMARSATRSSSFIS